MKKLFFIGILLIVSLNEICYAFNGYIESGGDNPNGRLYYAIIDGHAEICAPNPAPVGWGGFEEYKPTGSITIPSQVPRSTGGYYPVKAIRFKAFEECTGLTSVRITSYNTTIGQWAFYGCSNLTNVYCVDVEKIESRAFAKCTTLSQLNLGNSLTSIGDCAFGSCTSLEQILLPNSLTNIGYEAFENCTALNYINIEHTTPPNFGQSSCLQLTATLHVPCGSEDAYRSHSYWGQFAYIESDCDGIDGVDALDAKIYSSGRQIVVEGAEQNTVTLFDINGRALATKQDYGTAIRFDVPASGTYMIKIGNHAARKVVVMR